ncbi:hypothetical protein H0266_18225 [Halobacillus locisalis]|uniref:Uncharacterized protein n=1 Tax=Halobacillus locisalis TaxID=220753 RepID=A0A838CY98_9BACI|nr:hypothetical protein [Halobacillus locisalis]MBA2176819.1 hypothetical protein [Halobacillus locisalis]
MIEVRTYEGKNMIEVIADQECDELLEGYIGKIKVKETCNILRLSEVYGI